MINFQYTATGLFATASVKTMRAEILAALEERMTSLMKALEEYIKTNKLSGQVLNVETGALIGSVHAQPAEVTGEQIVGRVIQDESEAPYGIVQELGGTRTYAINPTYTSSEYRKQLRGTLQAYKVLHFIANGRDVWARYAFHPPLPKRSFMATALQEMQAEIVAGLKEAVLGVIIK